jgi:phosphomannomutase
LYNHERTRENMTLFTPFAQKSETIVIDKEICKKYSLKKWAEDFKLGTAGYRDLLDTEDFFAAGVPLNGITASLIALARANICKKNKIESLHIGGEVRPHTSKFIDLFSRIYAAAGITVHLRGDGIKTTPIWLSSFGTFYHELGGGENFTASHSPNYKGGWKPMDSKGMQLISMAGDIALEVKMLVKQALEDTLEIQLHPSDSAMIKKDFSPVEAYVNLLKHIIMPESFEKIRDALNKELKVTISTEGGSMGATARKIFSQLDFPLDKKGISFIHEEENQKFYDIGIVDGVNHGVDPGKWQVYKNIGAQDLFRKNKSNLVFIWDPDGDRFNIVTSAPIAMQKKAQTNGLETEILDDKRIAVYFKPNQIYFMLTAMRVKELAETGKLEKYDWIVAETFPTSRSIFQVASRVAAAYKTKLNYCLVPVGFKHFGNLIKDVQKGLKQQKTDLEFKDITGEITNLGDKPRFLIMCEESGGAAMGTAEGVYSANRKNQSLGLKEKDGMQVGLATLALAARLLEEKKSFARFYLDLIKTYKINFVAYERQDIVLYDESLTGTERNKAKLLGNRKKEKVVAFFKNLSSLKSEEITRILREKTGDSTFPAVKNCFWAGDGTFIEFDNCWFEIRASGTDAVLRYYFEGREQQFIHKKNNQLIALDI